MFIGLQFKIKTNGNVLWMCNLACYVSFCRDGPTSARSFKYLYKVHNI